MRFKEFTENWKKVKLSDISNRITRKNKNLETELPLTISAQHGLVDQETFFNKVVASKSLKGYYLLHNGEFAYNKSYSNGYPWGAIKRLDYYPKGALSTLYICFEAKNVDSDFLSHYFETTKWYYEISMIAVEGARNHGLLNIGINDFFNTIHKLPSSNEEQRKISGFLDKINNKLNLLNKKLEDYNNFKKYLMQQIFTQKLRFSRFEDKWKTVKLGDICNIKTGKLDANAMVENGKYRFYTCAKEYYYIDKYAYDTEALLISGNGAHVGYIHYYKGKFNAYQRTYILDQFTENIHLIRYILEESLKKRIQQEKNESNTPYIRLSTLKDMKLSMPQHKEEQEKIPNLLLATDKKIALIQDQLSKTEEFKKGLLQQMFVYDVLFKIEKNIFRFIIYDIIDYFKIYYIESILSVIMSNMGGFVLKKRII